MSSLQNINKCPLRIIAAIFIIFVITIFVIFWLLEWSYNKQWYSYWANYYASRVASEIVAARDEVAQYTVYTGFFSFATDTDPSRDYSTAAIDIETIPLNDYTNPAPAQAISAPADLIAYFDTPTGASYNRNKVYVTQENNAAINVFHNLVIDETRGKARIVSYATNGSGIISDIAAGSPQILSVAALIPQNPENVTVSADITTTGSDIAALDGTAFDQAPLARMNLYGPTATVQPTYVAGSYAQTPEFDIAKSTPYTFAHIVTLRL